MKLRLECDVDSQAMCDEILDIELENGHVLTLYPDDSRILNRIVIEASTSTWETSISSVPEQRTHQVVFKVDEELKEALITDLRFVESALCMYGVHALDWRCVKVTLVPESPREAEELQVTSTQLAINHPAASGRGMNGLKISISYRDKPRGMHPQGFKYEETPRPLRTHLLRDCFRPLTVPLSFFREGEVLFRDFRYVSAFRSYYYILEGFYAGGTHRNQERQFKRSKELVESVDTALRQLPGGDHEDNIHHLLDRYRKPRTAEGVLELLVVLRHDIQHYFGLTGKHAHAESESGEDYRSAALLAMLICNQVIWKKVDVLQRAAC